MRKTWSGDRLDFKVRALDQLAVGNVQVDDDNVRLEVTLPWLLHKFGEAGQKAIGGRGRILLEKVGFLAGIIARNLLPGPNNPSGFILTTVVGIAGAFAATYLGQRLGW